MICLDKLNYYLAYKKIKKRKEDFMEKIKLKNGQEFELVPMGIVNDDMNKRRKFKIVSELPYEEIKAIFNDADNIAVIDYAVDTTVSKTYADCVILKSLKFEVGYRIDESTERDIYIIELSTDEVSMALQKIQETLKSNQSTNDRSIGETTIMIADLYVRQ